MVTGLHKCALIGSTQETIYYYSQQLYVSALTLLLGIHSVYGSFRSCENFFELSYYSLATVTKDSMQSKGVGCTWLDNFVSHYQVCGRHGDGACTTAREWVKLSAHIME